MWLCAIRWAVYALARSAKGARCDRAAATLAGRRGVAGPVAWPEPRVNAWVEEYRQRLVAAGLATVDAATFLRERAVPKLPAEEHA